MDQGRGADTPYPSLTPTEAALLNLTIKRTATAVADEVMLRYSREHCKAHTDRTEALERIVFANSAPGVSGIKDQVEAHEKAIGELLDAIKWSKRMVYSALFVGLVTLVVAVLQATVAGG